MRAARFRLPVWGLFLACTPLGAMAQSDAGASRAGLAPPFHVAFVEGTVTLLRGGEAVMLASGEPLADGDRLQSAAGRVELRGPDGERVFLDQGSTLDVVQAPVFRLLTGAVRAELDAPSRSDNTPAIEIDTPHGTAALFDVGSYRISVLRGAGSDETEVIVRAGRGEVLNAHGRVAVAARQRVVVSAYGPPSHPETLAASDLVDSFDRWVDEAIGATAPTPSASYLPTGLASYSATLDAAGSWSYEPDYGHVWYPTVVANWQPYYYGFWRPLGYYGYTWVSHTPWAWATHHYGRWGFGAGGWFWIPGATWGSAWVSWGVGSGYVAWCPLGWGNRPVYPAPFRRHGPGWPSPHGPYGPRGPARGASGWTVVRAEHFRAGLPTSTHAVDWRRLGGTETSAFVEQRTPPTLRLAVARDPSSTLARAGRLEPGRGGMRAPGGLAGSVAGRSAPPASMTRTGRAVERGAGGLDVSTAPPVRTAPAALPTSGRAVARYPAARGGGATPVPGGARLSVIGRSAGVEPRSVDEQRTGPLRPELRQRWTPPPTHYGIPPARASTAPGPAPDPPAAGTVGMPRAYTRAPGGVRATGPVEAPRYAPRSAPRDAPRAAGPAEARGGFVVRSAPQPSTAGGPAAARSGAGAAAPPQGRAVARSGAPPRAPRR